MFSSTIYQSLALVLIGVALVFALGGLLSYAAYAVQVLASTWTVEAPPTPTHREG